MPFGNFGSGGGSSSPQTAIQPDPQVAINAANIALIDEIARADTLQGGETIAETGTRFDFGGRRWIALTDNAVVPDPLAIAALLASDDFTEFTIPESQYRRLFPDAISSNFTTWDNPNDLTLVLLFADGDTEVTFGRSNTPQTLTIPDLGARLFQFEGTGWFPVTPDSTSSSRLFRELDSWDVNGTNTRVHPPELLGNVEVVAIEDANAGANRFISKTTDLPTDGPRYLHFRVRIDAANTTSMMIRAAATNFPSELIVDLATGEAFVDNNGTAPFPVIVRKHVTSDFAEYVVRFPQIATATVWQLFPAVGPNGITNRNGYDPATVGKVYFEKDLDTNAAPEATGNPLYQWFFENYPILGTDRGCVVPYAGIEGLGVEFVDHGTDNFVVIGENFEINDPTFRVAYSIQKHTNGNSFFVDLRDEDNVLNRSAFNPTTGAHNFTGTGGGSATVRDDGDRWFVEIEFNLLQPGPGSLNRIDFVSDWRSGGGSRSSNVLYDFQLFAVEDTSGAVLEALQQQFDEAEILFSGDWRTIDFSQDTTTDGIGDTVWRQFTSTAAPRTLSIDSAEYNGGAQKIIKNGSNTHDLTVNFVTASDRFVLADNSQVASITVGPGEVYTMSRNSGSFWNVTAVYSSNAPAEIFTRLSTWQRINNAGIVQQGEIGGIPTAILTDFSGSTSHYRTTDFLPLTTPHTVKLRVSRDPAATTSMMLRTSGAGSQELIVNLDTGEAFGDNSGAGINPVVDQARTQITDDEIIVWATFQPNTGITRWDLFPAVGPNGITDGTGFNGATQGTLEIFELDLNATLPANGLDIPADAVAGDFIRVADDGNGGLEAVRATLESIGRVHNYEAAPNTTINGQIIALGYDIDQCDFLVFNFLQDGTNDNDAVSGARLNRSAWRVNDVARLQTFGSGYCHVRIDDVATGSVDFTDTGVNVNLHSVEFFRYV